MKFFDPYSDDNLIPNYGMVAHPYADVWPDLTAALAELYENKLGNLPWLPRDWKASVSWLHGDEGKLLVPVSSLASAAGGKKAKFLDTPEKRRIWDELTAEIDAVRVAFADKERQKGMRIMAAANANAAFWNNAYRIASVAALPATVTKGAFEAAADVAEVVNRSQKMIGGALLLGGAALVYFKFFHKK